MRPDRSRVHQSIAQSALGLMIAVLLASCDFPDDEKVAQDFKQIFKEESGVGFQPVIGSMGTGEGDADHLYKHIRFDVVVETDITPEEGWFTGMELRSGQELHGGEVVLLYQKQKRSEWVVLSYELTRAPRLSP